MPFFDGKGIITLQQALVPQLQATPVILLDQHQRWQASDQSTILETLKHLPQGLLLGIHQDKLGGESPRLQLLNNHIATLDNQSQSGQFRIGLGSRELSLTNGADIVRRQMGWTKIELQAALR